MSCNNVKPGESLLFTKANELIDAPNETCVDFGLNNAGIAIRVSGPFVDDDCQLMIQKISDNEESDLESSEVKSVYSDGITSRIDKKQHIFVINGVELAGKYQLKTTCQMPLDYISVFNDKIDLNHFPFNNIKLAPNNPDNNLPLPMMGARKTIHYLVQLKQSMQNRRRLLSLPKKIYDMDGDTIKKFIDDIDIDDINIDGIDIDGGSELFVEKIEIIYPEISDEISENKSEWMQWLKNFWNPYGDEILQIKNVGKEYMITMESIDGEPLKMLASPLIKNGNNIIMREFSQYCVTDEETKLCGITLNDYFDYDLQILNNGQKLGGYNINIGSMGTKSIESSESYDSWEIDIEPYEPCFQDKFYDYPILFILAGISVLACVFVIIREGVRSMRRLCCGDKERNSSLGISNIENEIEYMDIDHESRPRISSNNGATSMTVAVGI